jgi:hypothetical protein
MLCLLEWHGYEVAGATDLLNISRGLEGRQFDITLRLQEAQLL